MWSTEVGNGGRLEGKCCVITGAARGIGAATARLFASEGAAVVLADIKDELGDAVVSEIRDLGGRAVYLRCDVTQQNSVDQFVRTASEVLGKIDVLFNNAGTAIEGTVETLSEEDWDRTFSVNVKSQFLCARFVVPHMRRIGGGSIINMASESGLVGFPMHPAYCASKGAVINLTRSMAVAHASDGIRVNCICPGTIPTPLYYEFTNSLKNCEVVERSLRREHPLGFGDEKDIAFAALYLASNESSYMTGSPLIIDGGYTAK